MAGGQLDPEVVQDPDGAAEVGHCEDFFGKGVETVQKGILLEGMVYSEAPGSRPCDCRLCLFLGFLLLASPTLVLRKRGFPQDLVGSEALLELEEVIEFGLAIEFLDFEGLYFEVVVLLDFPLPFNGVQP